MARSASFSATSDSTSERQVRAAHLYSVGTVPLHKPRIPSPLTTLATVAAIRGGGGGRPLRNGDTASSPSALAVLGRAEASCCRRVLITAHRTIPRGLSKHVETSDPRCERSVDACQDLLNSGWPTTGLGSDDTGTARAQTNSRCTVERLRSNGWRMSTLAAPEIAPEARCHWAESALAGVDGAAVAIRLTASAGVSCFGGNARLR